MPRSTMQRKRPQPPEVVQTEGERFLPAPELDSWVRGVFFDSSSPLYSPTHDEIAGANVGWLWTNASRRRGGFDVLGEASMARPPMGLTGWEAAASRDQLRGWFGGLWDGQPADFKITVYAPWFASASDLDALALIKHELLHLSQARDEFQEPRFHARHLGGGPLWALRRHDVEEFVEVVEWFGASAIDDSVARLATAAQARPLAGKRSISVACGTCRA